MLRKFLPLACAIAALFGTMIAPQAATAALRISRLPTPARYVPRGAHASHVSLNVENAPIRTVLRLLFRRGNRSYVLGPGVRGTVTASLHHVLFGAALNQILAANSVPLTRAMKGNIYVIKGRVQKYNRSRGRRRYGYRHGR